MTHKEKDLIVDKLVDSNVALKNRIDFLEAQNYDGQLEVLNDANEEKELVLLDTQKWLMDAENTNSILLFDIRDLYKRLDGKNEDIQILNSLIDER